MSSSTPSPETISPETSPLGVRRRRPKRPHVARSTPCSSPARDVASIKKKAHAIKKAVETTPLDVGILRQLSISPEGLLNNDIRKIAWPRLLDVNVENIPAKPDEMILHSHRDYNQVLLDVNRSLKRFPPGMEEDIRLAMQDQLVDVIMWVLVTHQELHYYQGYHDICVTFLLVLGEEKTFAVMDKLSKQHLRDFMDKTMDKTNHMLNYLYPIIGRASPQLRTFMEKAETGTIFALSWLITWFGHVLNDIRYIVRLYDFFIACDPLMPIYLAAAVVLYREKDILSCEPEMPMIHCLLSRIPDDLPYEYLISHAGDLSIQYPPSSLAEEAREHYEKKAKEQAEFDKLKEARKAALARRSYFKDGDKFSQRRTLVRVTFWTLTAVISAAAFAVFKSRHEWENWLWGH